MENLTKEQISKEWVSFAKRNFYHKQFPEHQDFAPISDEQWDTFGKIMTNLWKDRKNPIPTGTEERQYYRAYAALITGGKQYAKDVASRLIDGELWAFSYEWQIIEFLMWSEYIFNPQN